MCGIFGIGFLNGHRMNSAVQVKVLLRALLKKIGTPDISSVGAAFVNNKKISVVKGCCTVGDFIGAPEFKRSMKKHITVSGKESSGVNRSICVIGGTSKKSTEDSSSCPIAAGKVVGVYNGEITNADVIFRYYSTMFGVPRKSELDGEIVFRAIDIHTNQLGDTMSSSIRSTTKKLVGNYTCALVSGRHPYTIWLFRNTLPIRFFIYPEMGVFIFSSIETPVSEVTNNMVIGRHEELEIPKCTGVGIDLLNNRFKLFNI